MIARPWILLAVTHTCLPMKSPIDGDKLTSPGASNWRCGYLATKQDVEEHFLTHGAGKIIDIKVMNGFGFIEYDDPMDARDVVPGEYSNPGDSLLTGHNANSDLRFSFPYVGPLQAEMATVT